MEYYDTQVTLIGYETRTLLLKSEVAEILRVSIRKIEYMLDEGKLTAIYVGDKSIRISKDEVEHYLRKITQNTAKSAHLAHR